MALVNHCFCCGVPIAVGFFTVYLLIAYLIAFAFELIWILEAKIALPAAAVLLCAGYFTMVLFAVLLVHGLATRTHLCLIAWMFAVTILTFPEAGLVIYMSVQYWRTESLHGLTELVCWFIRVLVNVVQLILVQSLFTMWRDEDVELQKRLQEINQNQIGRFPFYQNNTFHRSVESLSSIGLNKETIQCPLGDNYYFSTAKSEFNASVFTTLPIENAPISKKSQSMLDLRMLDEDKSLSQFRLNNWNAAYYNSSLRLSNSTGARPKLTKYASVDALDSNENSGNYIIKNRNGFYAQPVENYGVPIYYGPLDGPDFLIYKKQMDRLQNSKNSLSNASVDDVQKYRDVAL